MYIKLTVSLFENNNINSERKRKALGGNKRNRFLSEREEKQTLSPRALVVRVGCNTYIPLCATFFVYCFLFYNERAKKDVKGEWITRRNKVSSSLRHLFLTGKFSAFYIIIFPNQKY